jgi:hypothetical protein
MKQITQEKVMNSYEYVQQIKAAKGLQTDYAVAKFLGWKQNKITQYRNGQGMDNDAALQVAEILEVPVIGIIADMQAQRAKDEVTKNKWIQLAKSTGVAGMVALSLNVVPMIVNPAVSTVSAANLSDTKYTLYELMDQQEIEQNSPENPFREIFR